MEQIAPAGPVYQAGTLSGNPLAMAAGLATLEVLARPGVWERAERWAAQAAEAIARPRPAGRRAGHRAAGRDDAHAVLHRRSRSATTPRPSAPTGRPTTPFFHAMLDGGVYLPPSAFEAAFTSAAHGEPSWSCSRSALALAHGGGSGRRRRGRRARRGLPAQAARRPGRGVRGGRARRRRRSAPSGGTVTSRSSGPNSMAAPPRRLARAAGRARAGGGRRRGGARGAKRATSSAGAAGRAPHVAQPSCSPPASSPTAPSSRSSASRSSTPATRRSRRASPRSSAGGSTRRCSTTSPTPSWRASSPAIRSSSRCGTRCPRLHALERTTARSSRRVQMQRGRKRDADAAAPAGPAGWCRSATDSRSSPTRSPGSCDAEIRLRAPVTQIRRGPKGWTVGAAFQRPSCTTR